MNTIEITYVGLAYKNARQILYRYKVEGLDTNWKYTYATSLRFPTMLPGAYTFRVSAQNNEGVWSTNPASVSFTILPAWWATWWFRMFMLVMLFLTVFLVFRLRLKQLLVRNRLLNELNTAKQQALAAQMNPHFIYNALNSNPVTIINQNYSDTGTGWLAPTGILPARLFKFSVQFNY